MNREAPITGDRLAMLKSLFYQFRLDDILTDHMLRAN
jgi:hypothetical protein